MENFKVKKAIQNKIDEINQLMPIVNDLDNIPFTYDGGTYPAYVILTDTILVRKNYVYLFYENSVNNYDQGDIRFNLNKLSTDQPYGEYQLKHELNMILKAYKAALKKQNNG
jgi:hypothetical protein